MNNKYCTTIICMVLLLQGFHIIFASIEQNDWKETNTYCVKAGSIIEDGIQNTDGEQSKQLCKSHCFALWQEDPNNGSIIILGQGKIWIY